MHAPTSDVHVAPTHTSTVKGNTLTNANVSNWGNGLTRLMFTLAMSEQWCGYDQVWQDSILTVVGNEVIVICSVCHRELERIEIKQ